MRSPSSCGALTRLVQQYEEAENTGNQRCRKYSRFGLGSNKRVVEGESRHQYGHGEADATKHRGPQHVPPGDPLGSSESLVFTVMKLMSIMPTGLPTTRPKNTPRTAVLESSCDISVPTKVTPALARANRGNTTNDENGSIVFFNVESGGVR